MVLFCKWKASYLDYLQQTCSTQIILYMIYIYLLSLFIWYIPLESMMVGDLFLIVKLNDGVEHNLQEWIQLGEYQPNIYHPHIGGSWQFGHHTEIAIN